MAEDRIYAMPLGQIGDFVFDQQVVDVFPDMIRRSVPGYASIVSMTAELARQYYAPGTTLYDLGCSLGACTLPIASSLPKAAKVIAVDSSEAMVGELKSRLSKLAQSTCQVDLRCGDILEIEFEPSSFAVMNFTLQFIPIELREPLIRRIHSAMTPGGALVLSEKIKFDDPDEQGLMTDLHHAFKRANGYSELEIAQKRSALENALRPETLESHEQRLRNAGFGKVSCWFRCFNFVSLIALR